MSAQLECRKTEGTITYRHLITLRTTQGYWPDHADDERDK